MGIFDFHFSHQIRIIDAYYYQYVGKKIHYLFNNYVMSPEPTAHLLKQNDCDAL